MIKTFTGRPIRIHENRMDVLVYGNGIVTIDYIRGVTLLDHLKIMMEPGGKEVHNAMTYDQWRKKEDELNERKLKEPPPNDFEEPPPNAFENATAQEQEENEMEDEQEPYEQHGEEWWWGCSLTDLCE